MTRASGSHPMVAGPPIRSQWVNRRRGLDVFQDPFSNWSARNPEALGFQDHLKLDKKFSRLTPALNPKVFPLILKIFMALSLYYIYCINTIYMLIKVPYKCFKDISSTPTSVSCEVRTQRFDILDHRKCKSNPLQRCDCPIYALALTHPRTSS